MEWVETTGKTVEEAKEAALDQLGVHEDDAEFEVLESPRVGLFGRLRGEARVRARVRPTRPRAKAERRDRKRRRPDGTRRADGSADEAAAPASRSRTGGGQREGASEGQGAPQRRSRRGRGGGGGGGGNSAGASGGSGQKTGRTGGVSAGPRRSNGEEGSGMAIEVGEGNDATVEEQAAIMRSFLEGLVDAFDLDATFVEERVDDDTIELRVEGDNLGLLIGPKGQTLQSVQELARTVVQRQATGTHHGRVRIDIGGYRQRRKEALERFATQVANDVLSSGAAKALEPMHPADRKVVHDTINEIDGVATTSEGEEPRRRVVIMPAATAETV